MIHFPISLDFVPFDQRYPPEWFNDPESTDPKMIPSRVPLSDTWHAMESLKKASISLKKLPRSVLLYPEGTRTKDGSIHNFKPGGLLLAVETGIPIVPIYYSGTYSIIKEGPWKMNNQKLKLIIGKPILTEKYSFDTRRELAKKVQSEVLKLSNTFKD